MSKPPVWRLLDHTADLRIEVYGRDLADLLRTCCLAITDLTVGWAGLTATIDDAFEVEAGDPELAVFAVLAEVLFRLDARGLLPVDATCRCETDRISVALRCARFDPARHEVRCCVKAVTLHELSVQPCETGLVGRVVLDA